VCVLGLGAINGVESVLSELQEWKKSPYKMYERNPHTKCMRDPRPMYFVWEASELKKSPYKMYERNPHTKCMRDPRPMYFVWEMGALRVEEIPIQNV